MWRNYSLLLAFVSFSVSPAVADLVDVTFGGGANGSGVIIARCFTCPSGIDVESLSFGGSTELYERQLHLVVGNHHRCC